MSNSKGKKKDGASYLVATAQNRATTQPQSSNSARDTDKDREKDGEKEREREKDDH